MEHVINHTAPIDWEIAIQNAAMWQHLPNGTEVVPLVTVGGVRCADYAISGQLRPTAFLLQSPKLIKTLLNLDVGLGRCWLIQAETEFPVQENFHWYRYRPNIHSLSRTHALVYETRRIKSETTFLSGKLSERIERFCFDVLTPAEFRTLSADILKHLQQLPKRIQQITAEIESLQARWQAAFDKYGRDRHGELAYQDLIIDFTQHVAKPLQMYATGRATRAINIIRTMLQPTQPPRRKVNWRLLKSQRRKAQLMEREGDRPSFDRPIFILSTPRAGSTLLFETLSQLPNLWTIGIESHETIEGIPALHPAAHDWESNRLTAADATVETVETLKNRFARQLENRDGVIWLEMKNAPKTVRFLEKTPKNALRVPFLKAAFPDARFLYLYREPRPNISSMLEGWRTLRFLASPQLVGWPYKSWKFLLTPGWQTLSDKPLVEIVAHQWQTTQRILQKDLAALDPNCWLKVAYADLVRQPAVIVQQIAAFADLRWDTCIEQRVANKLPASRMVLSAPDPEKWKRHAEEIETVNRLLCL